MTHGRWPQLLTRSRKPRRGAPGAMPRLEALEARTVPSGLTFHVTDNGDRGVGSGTSGDLRYALTQVIADKGGDTIVFDVAGPVTLQTALPAIKVDVTIDGGPLHPTVQRSSAQGAPAFGIFFIDNTNLSIAPVVTIENLGITNGSAGAGGGIDNFGDLTLNTVSVFGNTALSLGGGVANRGGGTLRVLNSAIENNSCPGSLGYGGATVGLGGGIESQFGTVIIQNSVIRGNTAQDGGGIQLFGSGQTTTITNSTIATNTATLSGAGGISNENAGSLQLTDCTIAYNAGPGAGGIFNQGSGGGTGEGSVTQGNSGTGPSTIAEYQNTLFVGSGASNVVNSGGTLLSLGHNLADDGTGNLTAAGDLPNTNAFLGSLQVVAGTNLSVYPLLPGSPALDAGVAVSGVTADQRGVARPQGSAPDIGAFEARPFSFVVSGNSQSAPTGAAFAPLTVQLFEGPDPLRGVPIALRLLPGSVPVSASSTDPGASTDEGGNLIFTGGAVLVTAGDVPGQATFLASVGSFSTFLALTVSSPATHFALQPPANVSLGVPFDLTVVVLDALGNVAADYQGAVALSSNVASTFPPAHGFTRGDGGSFTFHGVVVSAPGTVTLSATDSASGLAGSVTLTVPSPELDNLALVPDRLILAEGDVLSLSGTFHAPGDPAPHTVHVSWGDGSPDTDLPLGAGTFAFTVSHPFPNEGTFEVQVTVRDQWGDKVDGSVLADVLLPGIEQKERTPVLPGQTVTVSAPGVTATLTHDASAPGPASLLVAVVPNQVIGNLPGVFAVQSGTLTAAYDVRVFNVSDADVAVVTFVYPSGGVGDPVLTYYDRVSRTQKQVVGSRMAPNSYVVDRASHTVRVIFDKWSTPLLRDMVGTLFTLSVAEAVEVGPAPAPAPLTLPVAAEVPIVPPTTPQYAFVNQPPDPHGLGEGTTIATSGANGPSGAVAGLASLSGGSETVDARGGPGKAELTPLDFLPPAPSSPLILPGVATLEAPGSPDAGRSPSAAPLPSSPPEASTETVAAGPLFEEVEPGDTEHDALLFSGPMFSDWGDSSAEGEDELVGRALLLFLAGASLSGAERDELARASGELASAGR